MKCSAVTTSRMHMRREVVNGCTLHSQRPNAVCVWPDEHSVTGQTLTALTLSTAVRLTGTVTVQRQLCWPRTVLNLWSRRRVNGAWMTVLRTIGHSWSADSRLYGCNCPLLRRIAAAVSRSASSASASATERTVAMRMSAQIGVRLRLRREHGHHLTLIHVYGAVFGPHELIVRGPNMAHTHERHGDTKKLRSQSMALVRRTDAMDCGCSILGKKLWLHVLELELCSDIQDYGTTLLGSACGALVPALTHTQRLGLGRHWRCIFSLVVSLSGELTDRHWPWKDMAERPSVLSIGASY